MSFSEFHEKISFFKYLLPSYYIECIFNCFKEIDNYGFYKESLKKLKDDGVGVKEKWNINTNDNTISFVINLSPEALLYNEADINLYESNTVSTKILDVENTLSEHNMFGMLKFFSERIYNNDYYAYGVTAKYKWNKITKGSIAYIAIYSLLIICSVLYATI